MNIGRPILILTRPQPYLQDFQAGEFDQPQRNKAPPEEYPMNIGRPILVLTQPQREDHWQARRLG